jgi:hypothetical protein
MLALALRCVAAAVGVLAAAHAHAQERPGAGAKPPATISGFRYELLQRRVHMNTCEDATCTPGSKVSYLFLPPNPSPSFEQYRAERAMIAEALKKRAAPGTTITFAPIEQTKDKVLTTFKANREEAYPDGRKMYFLNWRFHGAHMTGEIISSSPSKKAAEQNLALFSIPVLAFLMRPKAGAGRICEQAVRRSRHRSFSGMQPSIAHVPPHTAHRRLTCVALDGRRRSPNDPGGALSNLSLGQPRSLPAVSEYAVSTTRQGT